MRKVAIEGKDSYPRASATISEKRFMDDIIETNSDEYHLINTTKETANVLGTFGFELKTWFSNNANIGSVTDNNNKVLGLKWNGTKDTLSLSGINRREIDKIQFTKRAVLAVITPIWDPLGDVLSIFDEGSINILVDCRRRVIPEMGDMIVPDFGMPRIGYRTLLAANKIISAFPKM